MYAKNMYVQYTFKNSLVESSKLIIALNVQSKILWHTSNLYEITKDKYAKTFIENKQLYQIIDIDGNELRFRSFDATGELHDEFILEKRAGKPNLLIENN